MIYGVGTDIVQISRISQMLERTGDRFIRKILGSMELTVFLERKMQSEARAIRYLATRFAAKEAASKALGLGMRTPMNWQAVQTLNAENGKPFILPSDELNAWLKVDNLSMQVSISDEVEYAIAFVVVEKCLP